MRYLEDFEANFVLQNLGSTFVAIERLYFPEDKVSQYESLAAQVQGLSTNARAISGQIKGKYLPHHQIKHLMEAVRELQLGVEDTIASFDALQKRQKCVSLTGLRKRLKERQRSLEQLDDWLQSKS